MYYSYSSPRIYIIIWTTTIIIGCHTTRYRIQSSSCPNRTWGRSHLGSGQGKHSLNNSSFPHLLSCPETGTYTAHHVSNSILSQKLAKSVEHGMFFQSVVVRDLINNFCNHPVIKFLSYPILSIVLNQRSSQKPITWRLQMCCTLESTLFGKELF